MLKRLFSMFLTLFVVITIVFFLIRMVPGDPLASMARNLPEQVKANFYAEYGLDKPLITQYFIYMKHLLHGDFGESLVYLGQPIKEIILRAIPPSMVINIHALLWGVTTGIGLGILAAYKRGKWPDHLVMFIAILGVSIPSFVLATALQYLFSVQLNWLPTIGWTSEPGMKQFKYSIMPTIALSFGIIAVYSRYMRASVLDVLNQDYILTAKAKGVSGFSLAYKHVLRNSFIPAITILGPQIAGIIVGSFVIESIFGIPGFGQVYVSAITNRDFTQILGQTVIINALYIFSLFVVDIVYGLVDPRIRVFNK